MLEDIKILLGECASNFSDALIRLYIEQAKAEVEAYTDVAVDSDLTLLNLVKQIVVIKLNRHNTEGLDTQSYSGTSESYSANYPSSIMNVLNRKRRVKVL